MEHQQLTRVQAALQPQPRTFRDILREQASHATTRLLEASAIALLVFLAVLAANLVS